MAWITRADVSPILRTDLTLDEWIDGLIDYAQGLAEVEIGAQEDPTVGLRSTLAAIVARMWQDGESARVNPAGFTQETTGPFGFQDQTPGTAGLGLTNREIAALKKAVGRNTLGVISFTRGPLDVGEVREYPYRTVPDDGVVNW